MSDFISISQAFANWKDGGGMGSPLEIHGNDGPALAESWNDYTDSLAKDGQLCALQYHYCPSYDDQMPGDGARWDALSDDRAFILEAMGITLSAVFVPWSRSRNAKEKDPSLNWVVSLSKGGREVIKTDYMQGSGHCPAYNDPSIFPGTDRKRDQHTTAKRIREECETGRHSNGRKLPLEAPDLADVMHALLIDAQAMDSGGFEEWTSDIGMDADSIKAKAMFDACIDTGLKLRGAFGDKAMRDLSELFEGM